MLPAWALGTADVAFAVGGVSLFLEDAEEVVTFIFPSTAYVDTAYADGVLGVYWDYVR